MKAQKPRSRRIPPKAAANGIIRKVGTTSAGNVLVEMTPQQWNSLRTGTASFTEDLGALFIEYRKRNGIRQWQLAEMLGRSRNWVSAVERGQNPFAPYEKLKSAINKLMR